MTEREIQNFNALCDKVQKQNIFSEIQKNVEIAIQLAKNVQDIYNVCLENKRLRKENEDLKKQIEYLKGQEASPCNGMGGNGGSGA